MMLKVLEVRNEESSAGWKDGAGDEQMNVVSCFHPAELPCGQHRGRVRGVGGGSNIRTVSHTCLTSFFFFFPHAAERSGKS